MDSVDPLGLIIGASCLAFFVTWLLGRKTETFEDTFNSLPTAIVAFVALCAVPLCFYLVWQQAGAKGRLRQENLPVCAALGHVVGAQGGRAPRGIWRFEALDEPKNIFAYYEGAAPPAGWKLERKKNGILLARSGTQMAIWSELHGDKEQIVFQKKP